MAECFNSFISWPDLPLIAATGTLTPCSFTQSTMLSKRLHLCVAWKSSFAGPTPPSGVLYNKYGVRSALHVNAARNASMQWSTCARATAGLFHLSSDGTRPSGYRSREANCRTTFRQWRWWKTSTPAIYPGCAGGSAWTKPCSMLRLSEEMRSGGIRTAGTIYQSCQVRLKCFVNMECLLEER